MDPCISGKVLEIQTFHKRSKVIGFDFGKNLFPLKLVQKRPNNRVLFYSFSNTFIEIVHMFFFANSVSVKIVVKLMLWSKIFSTSQNAGYLNCNISRTSWSMSLIFLHVARHLKKPKVFAAFSSGCGQSY